MPWVQYRDGAIVGRAPTPQDGWVEVADDHPDFVAYVLKEAKTARKAEVDAERERRSALGAPVTLSGERAFVVQTRDLEDKLNISGMLQLASLAEAQNPGATIGFRAADNAIYPLSLDDCQALALQVGQREQALITAGWDHKDAIDDMASAEEVEAYDITADWPE